MNLLSESMNREIERQAQTMGSFHGPRFSGLIRKALARPECSDLTESDVNAYAAEYLAGAAKERARILAIDAALAKMPLGYEALAHEAKFVTPIEACDFVEQALRAHGQATKAIERMRSA